jgi:putative oxidoreductase
MCLYFATMDIIIYLGALLAGFGLSLIWKPDFIRVSNLARFYLGLLLFLALSTWIYYFAGIKNVTVLHVMGQTLKWLGSLGRLCLGYLVSRLAVEIKNIPASDAAVRTTFKLTLLALSIWVGNSFILATVGKSLNLSDMIAFFHQSGYAVWFLYFIMTAETLGAIGVLSHSGLRLGIPATLGLAVIMLGAVYTHWHNGDPFSDSYAAVSQLISESMLLFLYYMERKFRPYSPIYRSAASSTRSSPAK